MAEHKHDANSTTKSVRDRLDTEYLFYKSQTDVGKLAKLRKLPELVERGYRWISDTKYGWILPPTRFLIGKHPLWNDPQIAELLTVITLREGMLWGFNIYPRTKITIPIFERHGMRLPSNPTKEDIDNYCKTSYDHVLNVPVERTEQKHWERYMHDTDAFELENFDKIPGKFRSQDVYYSGLALGAIHIGEVPEEKRDYRMWLEACSASYSSMKPHKVFQMVPVEHLTKELVNSMTAAVPQGTCGLLDIIPKHLHSRTMFMNLAKVCHCYIERADPSIVAKETLVKLSEEWGCDHICASVSGNIYKSRFPYVCVNDDIFCKNPEFMATCAGCRWDKWAAAQSFTPAILSDYGALLTVYAPGKPLYLPPELEAAYKGE